MIDKHTKILLRILILGQLAVTLAAFVNEFVAFCQDCAKDGSVFIAGTGLVLYGSLTFMIWRQKAESWIVPLLLTAVGVHTMLVLNLIEAERSCWMCMTAAVGAILLATTALAPRPSLAWTILFFWPVGAAAASSALPFFTTHEPATFRVATPDLPLENDTAQITVLFTVGCPQCDRFYKEFGPKLKSEFHDTGRATVRFYPMKWRDGQERYDQAAKACFAAEKQGKLNVVVGSVMAHSRRWLKGEDLLPMLKDVVDIEQLARDMASPEIQEQAFKIKRWASTLRVGKRAMAVYVQARGAESGVVIRHKMKAWEKLRADIEEELGEAVAP